ncbi:MAG: adenine phosphoribosyltransferase [Austwickia sp.]|nr:adenine phosphoribosyltransferase [Actinomycetota bacterium]MCB1254348.1 adenine phosphoribosyltransferase [Austwickia sp.]MCO5309979.1 adenine phosphoribosyltransferase [Austwickia sp.]
MTDTPVAQLVLGKLREIPDFPEPGVLFRDFTPLLADGSALAAVVDDIADRYRGRIDAVVGIEARGFILATAVAYTLGVGFVPVRKEGKLPHDVHAVSYTLEYGKATLEMHTDALEGTPRVLVMDDVLATGGTAAAACELVERAGGQVVAVEVVIELAALNGRAPLSARTVSAMLTL